MGTWGRNTNSRHIFRNLQSVPSASYLTHTLPFKLSPTVNMSGSDDNGSPGAQEKPEAGASEHLNIKVTDNNNEVFFKIKRTTQLKKLMDAFCERQGKAPNSVSFRNKGKADHNNTPGQTNGGEESAWTDFASQDSSWRLKDSVCDEKDQSNNGVSCANHFQIRVHACDTYIREVGAIHQAVHIDDAGSDNQATIYPSNDGTLLFVGVNGIDIQLLLVRGYLFVVRIWESIVDPFKVRETIFGFCHFRYTTTC